MATLFSEDEEIKSKLEIIFLKDKFKEKNWLPYKLILESGNNKLSYEKPAGDTGAGDYVLAITPVNEIKNLINGINKFLKSNGDKMFSFEPSEPSFELILEKSFKGYSVSCWIDAGNVISNHYTWDGFGLRFLQTKKI